MTNARFVIAVLYGLSTLLLLACQPVNGRVAQQVGPSSAEIIFVSQQCGRVQKSPLATWIDDAQQLNASMIQLRSEVLGGSRAPLEVNFQQDLALLVEMGQHSTLGYGLELAEKSVQVLDGKAYVTLDWKVPPAGRVVAQMISSPCLMLKLQRGDFSSVVVQDRQGMVKEIVNRL